MGVDKLPHAYLIESIDVVEASLTELDTVWLDLDACKLQTQVYSFNKSIQSSRAQRAVPRPIQEEALAFESMAQVTTLPERSLKNEWNS